MDRKLVPLALLATLLGCSDDRQATEAGLRQAAQTWLDSQYPHCFVISSFPARTRDFDVDGNNKALHALAQVGVVSEKEVARTEVPARLWQAARTDIYYAYALTEEGRKYYKPDAGNGKVGGLCFGKAQVTAIEQFTAPTEQAGRTVSKVTYRYRVSELPAWAGDARVQAGVKGLGQAFDSTRQPLQATASMALTEQGWVQQELAN
ncbi:hypothetical protein RTH46_15830 [Pseudomonas sp. zfem004]|uniref:hypothetical protein n=1 Tax=unclassified Pseudomonas TaxID=196821 RepID=UPI00129B4EED|nr:MULTISPECIES: hypothetical protein [unclassified Pseudomonas]MDU9403960.1 hypothetical protein [Pseudomonas sp. zfem004]